MDVPTGKSDRSPAQGVDLVEQCGAGERFAVRMHGALRQPGANAAHRLQNFIDKAVFRLGVRKRFCIAGSGEQRRRRGIVRPRHDDFARGAVDGEPFFDRRRQRRFQQCGRFAEPQNRRVGDVDTVIPDGVQLYAVRRERGQSYAQARSGIGRQSFELPNRAHV